ncbi:hypothetical protein B0T19DRAFT_411241 [Cercophora scortea]|uniref:Subtelomeric hrmA-associated cluster protein AFUB-079030/YDR124W-like helical bundle domain-containing protein n=1 Tax=Cercophora scortea TaxID=314031 RepID=A0AAE0J4W0_9PEZI|nr:hypothetical protein B0T19DRAFT_411241 [Cercophora scortea]
MGRHDKTIDDEPPVSVSYMVGIIIGKTDRVWDFIHRRFQNCEDTLCERICNAWVEALVLKTQSAYPDAGDELPDWWPTDHFGSDKTDYMHYQELPKEKRVYLICHILKMTVQPLAKQPLTMAACKLNVTQLKELAFGDLDPSAIISDEKNALINDVFRVAGILKDYLAGRRDAGTEVFVNKNADCVLSNDEEPTVLSPAATWQSRGVP